MSERILKYDYLRVVQGYYAQGWEDMTQASDTREGRKEMVRDFKAYRNAEPHGRFRIISRREKNPNYKGK